LYGAGGTLLGVSARGPATQKVSATLTSLYDRTDTLVQKQTATSPLK